MRIERRFTTEGQSPYAGIAFRTAVSEIRNPDGSVVFHLADIQVPEDWSQVACDVLAQKYFRKAGVPARLRPVTEFDLPDWLWRRVPDEAALAELPQPERWGGERDARQVFDRLAGTWTYWGWKGGYFDGAEDARLVCGAVWVNRQASRCGRLLSNGLASPVKVTKAFACSRRIVASVSRSSVRTVCGGLPRMAAARTANWSFSTQTVSSPIWIVSDPSSADMRKESCTKP